MRNVVLFGICLVAIVIISGCTQSNQDANQVQLDCNDNNSCTNDTAINGNCTYISLANWTSCGDSKECYLGGCKTFDKCTNIWKSYQNKEFTYDEFQTQYETCYSGKYINYAIQNKDVKICDEIINSFMLGRCYGNVAYLSNYTLCSNVKYESYEAKGYYNNLTTTDVCYYYYSWGKYYYIGRGSKDACEKIENDQFEKECLKYV